MRKIIVSILLILSIFSLMIIKMPSKSVEASAPYKTFTTNRYNNLVETQEAYSPVSTYSLTYNGTSMKGAQDMVFDSEDYLYLCDTDNKRILICDPNMNVINSFGEDKLYKPRGLYYLDGNIYVTDYNGDTQEGKIFIYNYDKGTNTVTLDKEFGKPKSWILDVDGYVYKPIKIAVSNNGYMYVTSEGASSGVLMIDPENNFITYFGANTATYSLYDRIMLFLFEGTQWAKENQKISAAPYNVMLSGNGYVYTITQSEVVDGYTDNFKKINTGGENYFPSAMIGDSKFVDSYAGKYGNTYAITEKGYIFEYDNEGNLLFRFAGEGVNLDVLGLFKSASSIAVNSKDKIFVIDDKRNNLQAFEPTNYCNYLHEALSLYNEAKYEEALEIWQEVLRYNSMFDLAHKGVGLAYYMSGRYEEALEEFYIAYDKVDYSDAFWEIRNTYLIDNLSTIIIIVFLIAVSIVAVVILNKRFGFMKPILKPFKWLYSKKLINQTLYSYRYLSHPADSIYEVKVNKRASVLSSTIILVLIFLLYILGMLLNGFIFNDVIIEETILFTEGIKVILPILLFIVGNYLISSLMDGEGKFSHIYISTISSLTPITIIYPIAILVSNMITANEEFLFYFLIVVMFIWSGFLLFYSIKETHNYSVSQTLVNIIVSLFMAVILVLAIMIIYVMCYQLYTFFEDIIKEVIINA